MLCLAPWYDFILDEIICGDSRILQCDEKMLVYKICNTATYIASQVISKNLKKFAINSGILEKYHSRLHMKSEFLFRRMLLTDNKKRYMSKVMLREGTVFEKTDKHLCPLYQ